MYPQKSLPNAQQTISIQQPLFKLLAFCQVPLSKKTFLLGTISFAMNYLQMSVTFPAVIQKRVRNLIIGQAGDPDNFSVFLGPRGPVPFVRPFALKIWTHIQESSKDSSNQPDGPIGPPRRLP